MRDLFLFLSLVTLAICILTCHVNAASTDEKLSQIDFDISFGGEIDSSKVTVGAYYENIRLLFDIKFVFFKEFNFYVQVMRCLGSGLTQPHSKLRSI